MDNLPPPHDSMYNNDIPDYYLGCLLYYDEFGDDNCRWVVYDGANKVRCPSRTAAIDYITNTRLNRDEQITRLIVNARLHLNRAIELLRTASRDQGGAEGLVFERISARLRPYLTELDNKIIK